MTTTSHCYTFIVLHLFQEKNDPLRFSLFAYLVGYTHSHFLELNLVVQHILSTQCHCGHCNQRCCVLQLHGAAEGHTRDQQRLSPKSRRRSQTRWVKRKALGCKYYIRTGALLRVSSPWHLWAGLCIDTFGRKRSQSGLQQGRLKKENFCFCSGKMQQWRAPVAVESIYIWSPHHALHIVVPFFFLFFFCCRALTLS